LGVGLSVGVTGFCVAGVGVTVGVGVLIIVGVGSVSLPKVDDWLPLWKRAKHATEIRITSDAAIMAFLLCY
jgi:hypothetical protein